MDQIDDPDRRLSAVKQVAFLEAASVALGDESLGCTLGLEFDLRDLGLLYYVMSSSDTLGDALARASRYSRITNEAIELQYQHSSAPRLRLVYSGIPRHADVQQIVFCIVAMVRMARSLSGRSFNPKRVSIRQVRSEGTGKLSTFLGRGLEFGGDVDEIDFPAGSAKWTLADADPKLNTILLEVCEDHLKSRKRNTGALRTHVENTISPLLPHGQAKLGAVARKLGMSERTLTRRLDEEGITFNEILQQLKASLAIRYLRDDGMPISRVAWLLGFGEASSFTHACRRWTGKSPSELRLESR
jgi:AraC-like DNA-binding protein